MFIPTDFKIWMMGMNIDGWVMFILKLDVPIYSNYLILFFFSTSEWKFL